MATAAVQEECGDTECTICHEAFTMPKILPCGHILCRHCLISWLQTQRPAQCHLCRYPIVEGPLAHHSYEDVADTFPTHVIMAAMLEAERLLSKQHVCCVCENVAAVSLCISCGDMFCHACTTLHKKQSATKHHQVEHLTALNAEDLAAKRPATCAVHASELAQLYCPTHTVLVCLLCSSSDHRQCPKMVKMDARVAESRELLTQVASTLTAGERKLEGGVEEMEEDLKELNTQTNSGTAEIEAVRQRLVKAVDACCDRLKGETLSASGNLKEKMHDGKAVLLKERGRFSTHSKIVQQVKGFSTHGSFGDMAAMMKKRADSLDCSDDLMTSVRVTRKLTLTIDSKAVTRIEQELSQIGSVKTVDTKVSQAVLVFHDNHGKCIQLSNGGLTAARTDTSYGYGGVISKDPMMVNHLYEVCISAINSDFGYMSIGVVTSSPDTLQVPQTIYSSDSGTVVLAANSGCIAFGKTLSQKWPDLENIQVGTKVGVSLDSSRGLHLFVNGSDKGVITLDVPDPCYFLFDLHARCTQVTAQPVRPTPAV